MRSVFGESIAGNRKGLAQDAHKIGFDFRPGGIIGFGIAGIKGTRSRQDRHRIAGIRGVLSNGVSNGDHRCGKVSYFHESYALTP